MKKLAALLLLVPLITSAEEISEGNTEMTGKTYAAIHEAAHAVVSQALGRPIDRVSIEWRLSVQSFSPNVTHVHGDPYADILGSDWNHLVRAVTAYAGHMATIKLGYDTEAAEAGAADDYRDAKSALDSISELDDLQQRAMDMSKLIVETSWDAIHSVAEELEKRGTLTKQEIDEILRERKK